MNGEQLLAKVEKITSVLVDVTIIAVFVAAIIKLKLYEILKHRYRSEFHATHLDLDDGTVLFEGHYVVHTTVRLEVE